MKRTNWKKEYEAQQELLTDAHCRIGSLQDELRKVYSALDVTRGEVSGLRNQLAQAVDWNERLNFSVKLCAESLKEAAWAENARLSSRWWKFWGRR